MSILFRYNHNWSDHLNLDYEFRTTIITSRDQSEQRIAERIAPRRTMKLSLFGKGTSLIEKLQWMSAFLGADWVVPEFTRREPLLDTGGTSNMVIELSSIPSWVVSGALVVLDDGSKRELVTVDSVAGTTVTLAAATTYDWFAGGGYAYPGLHGVFKQTISGNLETSAAGTISAEFSVDPGDDHEPVTTPPLTFNGRELWMQRPNWISNVSLDLEGFLETVDFDRGVVDHYDPVPWNRRNWKATYVGRDTANAEDLLAFWHRLKGQQGEFYMPTWQDDLSLSIGAPAGSAALSVPGTTTSELFAGSVVYKAVIALFRDGTFEAKTVSSITDDGTNTTLNLGSAWSNPVNSTTAFRVCWLPVWRSGTDTLTMEWLTRTVAQCQFTFSMVEGKP